MNPQAQFCPNVRCHASGHKGGDNIVVHSEQQLYGANLEQRKALCFPR